MALETVKAASRTLVKTSPETMDAVLQALADELMHSFHIILDANYLDLERMDPNDPKYDRLLLNAERLEAIAMDIRKVASLPSPLGRTLDRRRVPSGLEIQRVTVPLGVVGIIYESRPNVSFDVFSLCLKSGNATVLKGGSDARESNLSIVRLIHKVLADFNLPEDLCHLLPAERSAAHTLLEAVGLVDIVIPRGSQNLIDYVRKNAKVPVIETGAGIVHTYLDAEADLAWAKEIICNAKIRRVSVCNALDTLIVHKKQLGNLRNLLSPLEDHGVEIFADKEAFRAIEGYPYLKDEERFGTEFLSLKMAIKTVGSLDEAMEHIQEYSSKHSEAILSTNIENIRRFQQEVDAAVVYSNTSTAFTDGAQFGLGAEIGISTQKLHARGPMGLNELCGYKWQVTGQGQCRR